MKKLLTILWLIIFASGTFIAIQFFNSKEEIGGDLNEEVIENETPAETETPDEISEIETIPTGTELPRTYSEYLGLGDQYLKDGNYQKAIQNYSFAVKVNDRSIEPLIKLADAYLINNQAEQAKKTYEAGLEISPESTRLKLGVAESYLALRDAENAKKIIWELPEEDHDVMYYRGLIYVLSKDFDQAKENFEKIMAVDPPANEKLRTKTQKFLDAYTTFSYYTEGEKLFLQTMLAKVFTENGHFQAVIPLLYDVINEKNNYRDAWIILGYAYLNVGQNLDAIDAFSQAKALDPEKPETLFFLGLSYFANNQIDNAIFYLESADEYGFEPKEQIDLKLGDLYLLKEEYEKSAQKYEKVLSVNVSNLNIFVRGVWLYIDKLNQPEKAVELAKKALANYPENPMSFNLVGWAYLAENKNEEAHTYLQKALQMDPTFDAANLNLGWLYEKEGQLALAKEYYKKAYSLGQGNAIARLAAVRFKNLSSSDQQSFNQINIISP